MSKEDKILIKGNIVEVLPDLRYKVEMNVGESKQIVLCYLCGKMKMHKIKVVCGDTVTAELSPYDLTKGRIIKREINAI